MSGKYTRPSSSHNRSRTLPGNNTLTLWVDRCVLESGDTRAKFPYSSPQLSPEQRAQRHTVRITNLRGDPIDTALTGLQQMHRAFDAQILEVGQRRLAEHRPQSACQGPLTGAGAARGIAQGETPSQAPPCPLLEAFDQRIGVSEMVWDDEDRL